MLTYGFICLAYRTQNVFEKDMVKPFTCYAEAFPSARYYWNFEEGNFTTVGPTLTFRHGIRRYQVGGGSSVVLFVLYFVILTKQTCLLLSLFLNTVG